jgi:L-2,4-diaminobutyrate decarboxylase
MVLPPTAFETHFLGATPAGLAAYDQAMDAARRAVATHYAPLTRPFSGARPEDVAGAITAMPPCPDTGLGLEAVLDEVGRTILAHSMAVTHPLCVAHLHCPPLLSALAAEVLVTATNQSMDSWDQAPAATHLEEHMVDWLCRTFGYGPSADGTFTSGGTQSNFMGLLLARDAYARARYGWDVQQRGLPPEASRFRIVCSDVSHFTVRQSAALLGLGHQAVVQVPTDPDRRMAASAVAETLASLEAEGLLPIAIVATAGTTDFGSIDPLAELAELAHARGLWLHVDAAYGGALILSDRHRGALSGIERADSVTVDFHKLFYQPISCGALLVRDAASFDLMRLRADYLNPEENEADGMPDLVGKSIQTTRRFDALKLFVTLRALGRRTLAEMIDATIELAAEVARHIDATPGLACQHRPALNAVTFRFADDGVSAERLDAIHREIRLSLLRDGRAVIAQTKVDGRTCLKLTLLNPRTTAAEANRLIDAIATMAHELAARS